MKDLDYTLKSETKRQQEEKQRFERLEQFKGIRKQERERVCTIILNEVYANSNLDNKNLTIKREVFEKIIEESKKGE